MTDATYASDILDAAHLTTGLQLRSLRIGEVVRLVGHDTPAFQRPGAAYEDHHRPVSRC